MLTTDILDRDLSATELRRLTPRGATVPTADDADTRLRDLRAILRQARGRAIRPRRPGNCGCDLGVMTSMK